MNVDSSLSSAEPLYRKLVWLTLTRLVLVSCLLTLASTFIYRAQVEELGIVEQSLFIAILVSYAASLAYLFVLRKSKQVSPRFAFVQALGDVAFANVVVYLTGGTESIFVFLLPLCVVSAANVLTRRSALIATAVACLLFVFFTIGQQQQWLPAPILAATSANTSRLLGLLLIDLGAICLTGLLAGYLAEQLRKAREALVVREEAYQALEQLHEDIVRSVPSGILTIDGQGRVSSLNPAAERILGQGAPGLLGRPVGEVLPFWHDDLAGWASRASGDFEAELSVPSGERRWLGVSAAPLIAPNRVADAGLVISLSDLTDRHAMAEAVQRSEKLAALGQLSAGLAHELRNPLASMSGSVQLLSESAQLDAEDRRLMDIVLREADRLDALITDFLRFARPRPLQPGHFDLARAIHTSLALLRNRPTDKAFTIVESLPESLPFFGDADQLGQVIWNLLVNAAQALRQEGGDIRVTAQRLSDGAVEIVVSDTGVGIAERHLSSLFDPFFTTKQGGTGLGLSIAHGIVQAHEGRIEVTSREGEGTTFRVVLPCREAQGAPHVERTAP
ncbi:MAG: PAS domain S-box protein [Myxococcaceae bacterium]|nr:PAS domain S-box protein [Myxococcaceae bacterium]